MHVEDPWQLATLMAPYLSLLAIPVFAAAATAPYAPLRRPVSLVLYYMFICGLVAFVGLRFWVGGDWEPYLLRLGDVSDVSFWEAASRRDPAYQALTWLSHQLGLWIYGVNVVCAAIFSVGLGLFCQKLSRPWLALAVAVPFLIVVVGMGYTRQSAAIGLVLAAFALLAERKIVWAILLVGIATTFHRSAPIALPFIVAAYWDNSRVRLALGAVIFFLAIGIAVLEWPRIERFYIARDLSSAGTVIRLAMNAIPAFIFLVFRKRFALNKIEDRLWFWVSIAAIVMPLALTVAPSNTLVDRAALYLIPLQLAVLSRLPDITPWPTLTTIVILGYSFVVMTAWLGLSHYSAWWFPYQNALFNPGATPLWVELGLRETIFWRE